MKYAAGKRADKAQLHKKQGDGRQNASQYPFVERRKTPRVTG